MKRRRLAVVLVATLGLGLVLAQAWPSLGHRATGERLERMKKSKHYKNGHFENPAEIINDYQAMFRGLRNQSDDVSPREPVEVQKVDQALIKTAPPSGLRVTWLGHSTTLIEIDGKRILTDPLFFERVSPLPWVGPTRWYPPLIPLDALPPIDAVIISHDHYDHLDYRTIVAMKDWASTFIVPLGVGAHLAYWGVPESRIVELDWWESHSLGALQVVSTPVRHASGRFLFDRDATLWSGYALISPEHRAFYSGDTGLFTELQDIGEKFGPFDVALIEVGQYHAGWPDWHLGPEQAVTASHMLQAKVLFPIHWGLLALAYHAWPEPIERTLISAKKTQTVVVAPKPGQSVEPTVSAETQWPRWWPSLPFETAEQAPVVSGNVVYRVAPVH